MKALLIALAISTAPADTLPDFSRPWSLEQCTAWALEHSLSVVQQKIAAESSEIDLNTAKWAMAPSVSGSASESWNFGRGIGGDNTYGYGNSSSTNFSIGGSMNLFDGMATPRRINLAKLNLDAATADLEKAREDIRVSVAKAYVQILYNYEIEEVARAQTAIDSLQIERLEGMLLSGKASESEVSSQKASLAQSIVTLTQAGNNLRTSILELAQLLEFPSWEGFSIERPQVSVEDIYIGTPDDIYADAAGLRPSVRAEQIRLAAARTKTEIAKSALYPSLSLQAGLGTNYYSTFSGMSFWQQLDKNFSQYVGLSLNIPIFDRLSTRNQIKSARLQESAQQIRLKSVGQQLYKEIQQAWNGAIAAKAKYEASHFAAIAAEDAFELVRVKYENGRATITEFNEARTQMLKTRSDMVQATYEYLFQTRLVNFYRSGELSL